MRGGRRKLVVMLAAGLALAGALAVVLAWAATDSHSGARAPQVLASFREPLIGFAQDGSWIASAQAPCGSVVAFRNLSSGRTWTLKDNNAECARGPPSVSFLGLALGGKRAVWSTGASADFYYTSLESAVAGGRAKTVVSETTWSGCGSSDLVQAQAADGGI